MSNPIFYSPDLDEADLSQMVNVSNNAGNTFQNIQTLVFNPSYNGAISIITGLPNVTSILFPYLVESGSPNSVGSSINIQSLPKLKSVWFPFYTRYNGSGAWNISTNPLLTDIQFPLFRGSFATQLGLIRFAGNTALVTIMLPSLTRLCLGLHITANPLLISIVAPLDTLTFQNGASVAFDFSSNALPITEVNRLLRLLANNLAFTSAGSSVTFAGGTNGAPSGDGITAKAALQARGVNVTTN